MHSGSFQKGLFMRTGKDVIVQLLLWSAAFSACAAETQSVDPATRIDAPPRIAANDELGASLGEDDKSGMVNGATSEASAELPLEAPSSSPIRNYRAQNSTRANLNSDSGIHLSMEGERPSLAYRFSESGIVRLRGNIRGARVVFSWSY
jgi:hypothetical protein